MEFKNETMKRRMEPFKGKKDNFGPGVTLEYNHEHYRTVMTRRYFEFPDGKIFYSTGEANEYKRELERKKEEMLQDEENKKIEQEMIDIIADTWDKKEDQDKVLKFLSEQSNLKLLKKI